MGLWLVREGRTRVLTVSCVVVWVVRAWEGYPVGFVFFMRMKYY